MAAGFIVFGVFISLCFSENALPPMLQGVRFDQKLNNQIPLDATFRDESGKEVRLKDLLDGKPAILSLVYYECPMLCTYVLNGVLGSLRAISFDAGKEFNAITISFDEREKPQLAALKKQKYLKEYGRKGAEGGWYFLTGESDSIQQVSRAIGFEFKYDETRDEFAHASGIVVLTPEGRIARYFYGVEYPARDLRLALVEASQNKIGSTVDQLLLFCFHYDPSTGKYSPYVLNLVRAGGIITVVMIGAFVLVMRRREKKDSN